ncbi:MAG: DUF3857 domain-containing protein [Planctomycetes bacterium]|nr:DUF3857 domain-containing protein [Planctomycetota bacterium]
MRAWSRLRRASLALLPFAASLLCSAERAAAQESLPPTSFAEPPAFELAAQAALLAGDPRAEGEAALRGVEQLARDAEAGGALRRACFELALQRIARTSSILGARSEMLERLEALDARHLDEEMRARWLATRRHLALGLGAEQRARALTAEHAPLLDWWVLGPLDNERGRGFARSARAFDSWDPELELAGKERRVTWREVPFRDDVRGRVSLEEMLRPNDQVMAYAIAFLEAPEERDAVLRLGSDEAFRVWWNGELVAEGDVRRGVGFDQNRIPLRVREGRNTLLLLIAEREGDWCFQARFTDPLGAPLRELRSLSQAPAPFELGAPDTRERRAAIALPPDGVDEAQREDARGSAFGAFCLGALLEARGSLDVEDRSARDALARAAARAPERSAYALAHAQALAPADAARAEERDVNPRRRALEALVAREPECVPALLALASHFIAELPIPTQARAWLERARALRPDAPEVALLESALLLGAGREAEHLAVLESAARGGDPRVREALLRAQLREGRIDAARALARSILEQRPLQIEALRVHTEELLRTARFDEAIALSARRGRLDPTSSGAALDLFGALRAAGRTSEAEHVLSERVRIAPEEPRFLELLSELRFEQQRDEEGLELLRRAAQLDPKDERRQRYLRWRESATKPFYDELRIDTAQVLAAEEPPSASPSSGEALSFLLDQRVIHLNRDATALRYVHQVIRVENEEGARLLDVFRVRSFPGEQSVRFLVARVLHPDGKVDQASFGRDARSTELARRGIADLPRLEPGDVVDLEYRHDDLAQSFFGNYFGLMHLFGSPSGATRRAILTLEHSRELELHVHERGLPEDARRAEEESGELRRRSWELLELSAVQSEPRMPAFREVLPALEITTYASWDAFGAWWWNLIRHQLEPSPELRAKVSELVAGASDEREKIRRLYEFVIREIKYEAWEFGIHGYQPYDAATIFARRFGDCKDKAILLGAMLALIDVPCHPVLIRSELPRSGEDLSIALVDHFNHCIAYVPPRGEREELWLDGTAEHHPLEVLPPSDRGAEVLVVKPEGVERRRIPPLESRDDELVEIVTVKLEASGAAEIEIEWRASGAGDPRMRAALAEEEGRRERKLTETLTPLLGELELESASFSPLDQLDQPVVVRARAKVARFGDGDGERRSLPSSLDPIDLRGMFPSTERARDLLLGPPRKSRATLRYLLPEGYHIERLPSASTAEGAGFRYERTRRAIEGGLEIERRFTQERDRLRPGDLVAARDAVNAIHAAEEERVEIRADREEDAR